MVHLSPDVKNLCLEATLPELNTLRTTYRHIIPSRDLRWLDDLIHHKSQEILKVDETPQA